MASLPSLGVSSLDLGRTDLRAAPFISQRASSPKRSLLRCSMKGVPDEAPAGYRHSAAARPSSSNGNAANTFMAMSLRARANFGKSLLLESVVSSR